MTVNLPAFTSNPPQIHHRKTTFCTPVFAKTPSKNAGYPARKKLLHLLAGRLAFAGRLRATGRRDRRGCWLRRVPPSFASLRRVGRKTVLFPRTRLFTDHQQSHPMLRNPRRKHTCAMAQVLLPGAHPYGPAFASPALNLRVPHPSRFCEGWEVHMLSWNEHKS